MSDDADPEKTNPTAYELAAVQWAARRLAHHECAERGTPQDLEVFDAVFKAERKRIASTREGIDKAVRLFKARPEEGTPETPESEAEFYRQFPPTSNEEMRRLYGEPEGRRVSQKAFSQLDAEQKAAVNVFVAKAMGYPEGNVPFRLFQEYKAKRETVAGDPEFFEEAIRAYQDRSRER